MRLWCSPRPHRTSRSSGQWSTCAGCELVVYLCTLTCHMCMCMCMCMCMYLLWYRSCLALLHRCGLSETTGLSRREDASRNFRRMTRLRMTSTAEGWVGVAMLVGIPRGGCQQPVGAPSLLTARRQSLPIKSVRMQQRGSRRSCRTPLAMSFSGEPRAGAGAGARARAGTG